MTNPGDNLLYSGIDCTKNIAIMKASTPPDLINKCGFFMGYCVRHQMRKMQIFRISMIEK